MDLIPADDTWPTPGPEAAAEAHRRAQADPNRPRLVDGLVPLCGAPTRADVERDQAANDARFLALAQSGVQMDLASVLRVRFNELLEQLLGDMDAPARLEHERRCNARYRTMLDEVESQVARARLLQGVQLNGNGRG